MRILFNILKRVPVVVIYQLSKLFPRTKKIIVFGGENGKAFRGNTKYLFIELVNRSEFKCVWITKSKKTLYNMRKNNLKVYTSHSLMGMYYQLRAGTAIHSHSIHDDFNKVLLGGVLSINTWHGVGLKKVWAARSQTFSYRAVHEPNKFKRFFMMLVEKTNHGKENYVFSTSEAVSEFFPETFLLDKSHLPILGQVRNDVFYKETEEEEELPYKIRNNTVITYMPTHRNHGKNDPDINDHFDFYELDRYCEDNNMLFVLKRHMFSKGTIPPNLKNIIDISEYNIEPQILLKHTDLLITDYSSCYTDFLLLDRPVIFYPFDLDDYLKNSNDMYFDYNEVTPGPKVTNFKMLMSELTKFLQEDDRYKAERLKIRNLFYAVENQQPVLEKQICFIRDKIRR